MRVYYKVDLPSLKEEYGFPSDIINNWIQANPKVYVLTSETLYFYNPNWIYLKPILVKGLLANTKPQQLPAWISLNGDVFIPQEAKDDL